MKDTIGIDISKATLDIFRQSTGKAAQFPNSAAGLRALRDWIGEPLPDLVVYEATGAYHAALGPVEIQRSRMSEAVRWIMAAKL